MNEFDENISDKLRKRTITPSSESWSKLADKLEQKDKKSNRKFWWLGVAASFLAGILLSSLLFKTEEIIPEKNDVVIEENLVLPEQKNKEEIKLIPLEVDHDLVNVTTSPKELKSIKKIPAKTKQEENRPKNVVASAEIDKLATEEKINPEKEHQLFIAQEIDKKAQEVVDRVKELSEVREVTDEEIDQLIRNAQLEIRTRKIFDEQKNKVNAQALLQDVEAELDQSFRERIFVAIENGFTQVKSAVSFMNL
ncbi:hypothetical protein [Mesonia aquimarina]|uniref:hypothetical protein n=1 Tax=Mesonia aquimarina TaxID=1504967 RepID=UPI000EF57311|nr:hypothetical protein [Mesonia aquimarina]